MLETKLRRFARRLAGRELTSSELVTMVAALGSVLLSVIVVVVALVASILSAPLPDGAAETGVQPAIRVASTASPAPTIIPSGAQRAISTPSPSTDPSSSGGGGLIDLNRVGTRVQTPPSTTTEQTRTSGSGLIDMSRVPTPAGTPRSAQ